MTQEARACIAGAFEHPTRLAPDKSVAQQHAECSAGSLQYADQSQSDFDCYFGAGDAHGSTPLYHYD